MALDDLIGNMLGLSGRAVETARCGEDYSMADDAGKKKLLEKYAQLSGLPFGEGLKKSSPVIIRENIDTAAKKYEGDLAEFVEKNYSQLVGNSDEGLLLAMAMGVSGEYKLLRDLDSAMKAKEFDKARSIYAKKFEDAKDNEWAHAIKNVATEKELMAFIMIYQEKAREYFIEKNRLYTEKESDGKKTRVLDKAKIVEYMNRTIGSLKDDQKKTAYAEAGKATYYFNEEMRKMAEIAEAQEKAKKEKDAKEKGKKK